MPLLGKPECCCLFDIDIFHIPSDTLRHLCLSVVHVENGCAILSLSLIWIADFFPLAKDRLVIYEILIELDEHALGVVFHITVGRLGFESSRISHNTSLDSI